MMIGLPGDTLEKSILTAKRIIELGAVETRIYPVLVIKDTKLAEWYEQGKYRPLSLNESVSWLKELLPLFEQAGVEVTRVGLHSSVGLESGKELVAGPYHTSIREMAMTEVWWDRLQMLTAFEGVDELRIIVHPSQYNFAVGYYAKNRKKLSKCIKDVRFLKDENLRSIEFNVEYR